MERYSYTLSGLLNEDAELIRMLNNVSAAQAPGPDEGW